MCLKFRQVIHPLLIRIGHKANSVNPCLSKSAKSGKKFHSTSHSITPPVYPCVSNSNKSCSRYKPKCSWWFRSIFLSSDGKKSCFKIQIYWWALPRIQCKTCQKTYIGNDYTEKNGSKMTLTNGLSANGTTPISSLKTALISIEWLHQSRIGLVMIHYERS